MESSPVEQVRAGVDIVDLVGQYVSLKKAGRTFKALCPFHSEKTPSFVVFPDTGHWHCFGCGEGGDVFSFLMKIENLTFPEALRRLADRIGIVITHAREGGKQHNANERLYAANEAAAIYFHGLLLGSSAAREYVAKRGITADTIQSFLLGLAPQGTNRLHDHLRRQGFTTEELSAAGLLYEPDEGPPRDRYHHRLMFPIRDIEGRIVSFGARGLTSDAVPKYLNGPQTELFDKSAVLFGLHAGASAIRKERQAVIVEGYVDVVIAHQAGFQNVVATLGTSITERHLRQLARLAPSICLALDPDAAGESAVLRSAEVGRAALADAAVPVPTWRGLVRYQAGSRATISVAVLPDGKDPDELVLENPDRWRAAIASARPLVDHAIDHIAARHDLATARGKSEAAEALVPLLQAVVDPIEQAHYVELAAHQLHVDSAALITRVRSAGRDPRRLSSSRALSAGRALQPSAAPRATDQHYAIALFVAAIQRGFGIPDIDPDDFRDPAARALVLRMLELTSRESLGGEWRPDLLEITDDPWLDEPIQRVRAATEEIERLTDAQVQALCGAIGGQLRAARLAAELPELSILAQEAEPDQLAQIKARIGQISNELVALRRALPADTIGPSALGRIPPLVPPRFRAVDLALAGPPASPPSPASSPEAPEPPPA
ncbi:MAG TPA: DNA primase [Chloroflexota bacterium]|nr:DNA primase [Chloroflexota bacterium]